MENKNSTSENTNNHKNNRKQLSVSGAMFHVSDEHLKQYFEAVNDVVGYVKFGGDNQTQQQALYSALELREYILDELYERSFNTTKN